MKKLFSLKTTVFFLISAIFMMSVFSCSNFMDETIQNDSIQKISIASDDLPTARVEEPVFVNEGVAKNKAIIIRFSKPMDRQSFMESLSITDPIGTNLKSYFLEPQWSNNNKMVTIPANEQNLIDLRGKKTMDIYVTLLKTCMTVDGIPLQSAISDYKYRICDMVDNELPQIASVKAMLPQDFEEAAELIEGELTVENEALICSTNHINSKLNFYVEGSDYGGGEVFAHIQYARVNDVNGNPVEEEPTSLFYKLDSVNFLGNYFEPEICLDLSGEEFLDGMYKILVTVADSSLLDSENAGVYYVIRDTAMAYSANALICFEAPVDSEKTTISEIEYCRNRIKFDYVLDDVFYVSRDNPEETVYKQSYTDFTYLACWGKKLDSLCEPVILEADSEEQEQPVYSLPPAFKYYCDNNVNEDIFLQVIFVDSVGNKNSITTLIPKQIEFYNYEVLEGSQEETRKIKLNYADMSTGLAGLSKLEGKDITALSKIYYGKIEEQEEDTEIDFSTLELTESLDPEIEFDSKYVFYIQSVYDTASQTNGQWCGQTFGPSCMVIVDLSELSEEEEELLPEVPEFTIAKESAGQNTGLFIINIEIENLEEDLSYVPCFSTDGGQNWIYYNSEKSESFSFLVINPLRAPLGKNEAWDNYNWQGDYFTAIDNQTADYGEVTAKVKLLAIRGNTTSESKVAELVFTQEDDNIPPAQSNIVSNHDSILSFDGHSFVYDGLVLEDEGHAKKTFTYYYMPYNEVWGNNLFVAQDTQIEMLPFGTSVIASSTSRGEKGALYSLNPVIPVNGLKDGKYMFFAKVSDTYGNYRFITLGKASIGTFKNKLEVQYDTKNKNFISRLPIEPSEKLDKNMINVQFWKKDDALWDNYYDKQNELQACETINSNGKTVLYNQTKKDHYTTEYQYLSLDDQEEKTIKKRSFQKELQTGIFYRFTMQGYNQHEYDGSSGVNIRYGMPYNDNPVKETVVPLVPGETEYDLCTEETVSNTVYYYLAAPNDNLKGFKASFFKNTASPRSNYPYIVNVISSLRDLGNDIDEWERRGKLVATHYYDPDSTDSRYNKAFNDTLASEYMSACVDKGLVYYAAVVHFADNSSVISNVYQLQN